jgi:hypothetical protein
MKPINFQFLSSLVLLPYFKDKISSSDYKVKQAAPIYMRKLSAMETRAESATERPALQR